MKTPYKGYTIERYRDECGQLEFIIVADGNDVAVAATHAEAEEIVDEMVDDLREATETNDERYQREARTPGTQAWAETRGDDLGDSPDY